MKRPTELMVLSLTIVVAIVAEDVVGVLATFEEDRTTTTIGEDIKIIIKIEMATIQTTAEVVTIEVQGRTATIGAAVTITTEHKDHNNNNSSSSKRNSKDEHPYIMYHSTCDFISDLAVAVESFFSQWELL